MIKKVMKEFFIYRLVEAQIVLKVTEIEGDLDKIICKQVEKLAFALKNLLDVNQIENEFTSCVKNIKNGQIEVGKKICVSSEKDIDFGLLIQSFLIRITQTDDYTQKLFKKNLAEIDELIEDEAIKFLLKNENKKIRQGLVVSSDDFHFKMAGKFSKVEHKPTSQCPPFSHTGMVRGILRDSRLAHFKSISNKTLYAYYNHEFYNRLYELLDCDEICKFTFRIKNDPKSKEDVELINIDIPDFSSSYPLI